MYIFKVFSAIACDTFSGIFGQRLSDLFRRNFGQGKRYLYGEISARFSVIGSAPR
jgi:hypothetical protein